MLPTRVYETNPVQRTIESAGLDIVKLRDISRVSASIAPLEEFTDRALAAVDSIEDETGLKLFQGSYTAEFDLVPLRINHNYLVEALEIPGINSTVIASSSGDTSVRSRITTVNSRTGVSELLPPYSGWPIQDWDEPVNVTFTAGGNIKGREFNAVGAQLRFEYYPEPNNAMSLDWYISKLALR